MLPIAATRPKATGVNRVVLVVDDSPEVLRLVASALDFGYDIVLVSDPRSVLTLSEDVQVDLLLADVRMPALDGIGLVDVLRERNPHMPVVFMSGYFDQKTQDEALRRSQYTIGKPFRVAQLREMVREALGDPSPAPLPPAPPSPTRVKLQRREGVGLQAGDVLTLAPADPEHLTTGSLLLFEDGLTPRVGFFRRHLACGDAQQAELRCYDDGAVRHVRVPWPRLVGRIEAIERDGVPVPAPMESIGPVERLWRALFRR